MGQRNLKVASIISMDFLSSTQSEQCPLLIVGRKMAKMLEKHN